MRSITITEGESAAQYDFYLKYSQNWSESAKRGQPVQQSDVTKTFFYVKALQSDSAAWLSLTDASSSQIEWVSAATGHIRVKFGAGTAGHAGDNQFYELRLKLTSGKYVTAESGHFNVKESIVDQAV
jgi:hypothetical protein